MSITAFSLVATAQPDYRPMLCEGRVWNEHADMNGDGKVDVADIATIISVMAGQPSE